MSLMNTMLFSPFPFLHHQNLYSWKGVVYKPVVVAESRLISAGQQHRHDRTHDDGLDE
jgi:hypothetical protein